jgi:Zn-finger nucleic acid-binding protein
MLTRLICCPTCERVMEHRDRHGVDIDQCPACRGVWLDKGELDTIIQRSARFLELPDEDFPRRGGHRRDDFFQNRFEWF